MPLSTTLNVQYTSRDGILIIDLLGAIDTPHSLEPVMESAAGWAERHVVVLLNSVEYINSTGFGALIRFSDTVTAAGKELFVVGLQTKVHVAFTALGVQSVFNVLPTIEDAFQRIKSANQPKS